MPSEHPYEDSPYRLSLDTPIDKVFMIGPQYANRLKKLNISTVNHLLHHYPFRYEDLTQKTVKAKILKIQNLRTKNRKLIQIAQLKTDANPTQAIWFNQPYLSKTLKPNTQVYLAGETKPFSGKLSFYAPEFEIIKDPPVDRPIHTNRLVPIYPETGGVSSKWLRSRINWLLNQLNIKDFLPASIKKDNKLINLKTALNHIHFPDTKKQLAMAKTRLSFDELFLLQLKSLNRKIAWTEKKLAHNLSIDQEKILKLINRLPFKLTSAQNKVLKEILNDLQKQKPMNRLLQGDVGSGKTVVAAIIIYASYLNGFQSILMAPTEILANQHFDTLSAVLKNTGLKISLITSSTSKLKTKNQQLQTDVLVGTHALLHRKLDTNKLGLVIIDEQHRFGVKQRSKLLKSKIQTPHLLSMTATPIPRTIALTAYADLNMSILDQMPPGRIPVKTWLVPKHKHLDGYHWIEKQIKKNNSQAFVVCPLIEASDKEKMVDIKNVTDHFNYLNSIFNQLKLGLLHGKLKNIQKQKIIKSFVNNQIHVLISTSVIEVGIDIPNASIMVIEDPERFGLAQLHQLRGRIGRNNQKAYCLLFTDSQKPQTLKRLKPLEHHHSGIKLAELDLKLRGPGQIYGLKQHGYLDLKLASFSDLGLVNLARKSAQKVIKNPSSHLKKILKKRKITSVLPN